MRKVFELRFSVAKKNIHVPVTAYQAQWQVHCFILRERPVR